MRHYPKSLGERQKRLLRRLGPILTPRGFYLGGGTALALRLGHRRSVDLAWFTEQRLGDPLRLAQLLREAGIPLGTDRVDEGTLYGTVWGIQVSWLEYRYPLLQPCDRWRAFQCELAAQPDLAAMKLSAIAQRGAKKDFVDLYALLIRGMALPQMLTWYQQKFGVQDTGHLLYSLVYFQDADRERMPRLLRPMNWKTIKDAIRDQVRRAALLA
jgi:hypothetical protein